jgi:2-iminobutanoate/2-iminopropanoate deaminase
MKKVYGSSESSNAPLSSAWEANGLIFLSGQIHADKGGKIIEGTIEDRFGVVMGNVKEVLATAGLTIDDIVQVKIYLTDLTELPALNETYKKYFNHPFPARTALGVSKLPLGASLEIEIVAARQ